MEGFLLLPASEALNYASGAMAALEGADALVIVTEWKAYRSPDFERMRLLLRQPVVRPLHLVGVVAEPPGQVVHAAHLVDHGAAHPVLGEGLELHVAGGVEAARGLDEPHGAGGPEVLGLHGVAGPRREAAGEPVQHGAVPLQELALRRVPRGPSVLGDGAVHGVRRAGRAP